MSSFKLALAEASDFTAASVVEFNAAEALAKGNTLTHVRTRISKRIALQRDLMAGAVMFAAVTIGGLILMGVGVL